MRWMIWVNMKITLNIKNTLKPLKEVREVGDRNSNRYSNRFYITSKRETLIFLNDSEKLEMFKKLCALLKLKYKNVCNQSFFS